MLRPEAGNDDKLGCRIQRVDQIADFARVAQDVAVDQYEIGQKASNTNLEDFAILVHAQAEVKLPSDACDISLEPMCDQPQSQRAAGEIRSPRSWSYLMLGGHLNSPFNCSWRSLPRLRRPRATNDVAGFGQKDGEAQAPALAQRY